MGIAATHKLNVASARAFCLSVAGENQLYVTIGSSSSLSASPTDADSDATALYTRLIGAKRVKKSDCIPAVPRVDWVSGARFNAYSSLSTSLSSHYCLADTVNYNVYLCMSSGTSTVSQKPTTTDPSIVQVTSDNFSWKFLYTLSDNCVNQFLDSSYLPVPFVFTEPGVNDQTYSQFLVQKSASSSASYIGSDAGLILNSKYVIISSYIRFGEARTAGGVDIIPTGVTYYQTGLILNPIDSSSSTTAIQSAYGNGGLITNPGTVLLIDNLTGSGFTRSGTTIDNVRFVLQF